MYQVLRPATSTFVSLRGCRYHLLQWGPHDSALPPLVLAHGWMDVAASWQFMVDALSDAFASGWMQLRGARRRGGWDRGFVLSDHADWPGLLNAIAAHDEVVDLELVGRRLADGYVDDGLATGSTMRAEKKAPLRFMSIIMRQDSGVSSSNLRFGRLPPAELTRMSTMPCFSRPNTTRRCSGLVEL